MKVAVESQSFINNSHM